MITIPENEISFTAVRAQGAGGQNVNKVSSAVHLRFSIPGSSLPDEIKQRLLALRDHRITAEGEVIIKAQTSRSQDRNKAHALERLQALIESVSTPPKPRKPTKPTAGSQRRRLQRKALHGEIKRMRGKVEAE